MTADFLFWLLAVISWFIGAVVGFANSPDGQAVFGRINWLCLGLAFAGITFLVG